MSRPSLSTQERVMYELGSLYGSYGYARFKPGKFEEYDLYARNKNFLSCKQVLTFSDTDGRLMALKPDITLSIIKSIRDGECARKLFYTENVYRVPPDGGGFREIMQTGLEYIGRLDRYALSEVLMLAAKSLESISADYVLDISHLGIISGILAAENVSADSRRLITDAISQKNGHELILRCEKLGVSRACAELLKSLLGLYGPIDEVLKLAAKLPLPAESLRALDELRSINELLKLSGLSKLRLDFSLISDMEYYSGIVFSGFVSGIPAAVLSGGRYDLLLEKMGLHGGAIGFAVYLDRLERFMENPADFDADVLILYHGDENMPEAVKRAAALVSEGKTVRVEREAPAGLRFCGTENIEEAGRRG